MFIEYLVTFQFRLKSCHNNGTFNGDVLGFCSNLRRNMLRIYSSENGFKKVNITDIVFNIVCVTIFEAIKKDTETACARIFTA
jgi:hypothetical protein